MQNHIMGGLTALLFAGVMALTSRPATENVAPVPPASDTSQTETIDHSPTVQVVETPSENPDQPQTNSEQPSSPAVEPSDQDTLTGLNPEGPTIIMVSQASCPPCNKWWVEERQKWIDKGWKVKKVDITYTTGVPGTPYFRVFDGKRWFGYHGPLTGGVVKRFLGKAVSTVRERPKVLRPRVTRGTYQGGREWSYPGDISDHLMGPNHGFTAAQLAGKSKAELERLHSQHHEGMKVQPRRYIPTGFYKPQALSNCPGGVCPTTTRRGLFGWRR